jgi:hypothetical protein
MSDINTIIQSNITRENAVASLPGFGVPAIMAQFTTAKTVVAFDRHRYYASTSEMTADGWASTDSVYQAAAAIFSQNPKVPRLMVGRIDSADASPAVSADAIRAKQDDWYAFEVVGNRGITFALSTALITGNVVASTINGITIPGQTFATSHAATMAAWATAIQTALGAGTVATVSVNSMVVVKPGTDLNIGTIGITLGASQPTVVTTYPLDATKTKAWMAWTATQKKLQFVQDSDPATKAANTGVSGTACLAEFALLSSYDRVAVVYHVTNTEYVAAAWMGRELPYDPGLRTWAFKNLTGITPTTLTTSEEGLIRTDKRANVYTTTASYSHTYAGTVAKVATYIDDVRNLDWVNSTIQTDLFNLLAAMGKVPFTDLGIQAVVGTLKGSLQRAQDALVFDAGWAVNFPLASAVSSVDKAARRLTGITWNATLQGAVHSIIINGTVSV